MALFARTPRAPLEYSRTLWMRLWVGAVMLFLYQKSVKDILAQQFRRQQTCAYDCDHYHENRDERHNAQTGNICHGYADTNEHNAYSQ